MRGVSRVPVKTANGTKMVSPWPKPREPNHASLLRWRVSLIKDTPAKFIDYVEAPDAKTAESISAKEHRIPDTLRDRLVAIREDL